MRSSLGTVVVIAAAAVLPVTAHGQTAAPRPQQAAPALRPAQAAPAPPQPPQATPANPPAAPGGARTSAPVKVRVPANLFKLGEGEIIFVGGKNMTAGEVRRDLRAQVIRAAGAPKLVNVASKKVPGHSKLVVSAEAAALLSRNRANQSAPVQVDCTQQPPNILSIQGSVAPGQQFTIIGNCFGDQNGDVKIIGQFPGGNLHVSADPAHPGITFTQWSTGRIVAALPAVSGSADQAVAISVTTHTEKRESTAKQATFTAARERVEVPARLWSAPIHYEHIYNDADTKQNTGALANPVALSTTVNPVCALDNIEVKATTGKIASITGWPDGPPNTSTVQITWEPQVTVTSYWYAAVDDIFSSAIFDVKAWATCPVGFAP